MRPSCLTRSPTARVASASSASMAETASWARPTRVEPASERAAADDIRELRPVPRPFCFGLWPLQHHLCASHKRAEFYGGQAPLSTGWNEDFSKILPNS